ncbi:unnamed protein product [Linum trigynum]|uniref:ENTH domain-containing protein n=1 Tax=Linum trigynum TaxID=586398 RepID=A0AAV2CT19_9ROSI
MAPSTFRKAIGAVKDHTTIGLAKVAGTISPELEVLVVKATSHGEEPTDEKYYREILSLTSSSRGYMSACVATVSKRLSKTHDWMVALKSLMLVHRILADGHPSFEDEILYAARSGMRILNMSDFRAEASSNSWDHAGFVRFYAMYLDEKVGSSAFERKWRAGGGEKGRRGDDEAANCEFGRRFDEKDEELGFDRNWRSENQRRFDEREDELGKRRWSNHSNGRGEDETPNQLIRKPKDLAPIKEMATDGVLGKSSQLLRVLDRILACRPAGMARTNRLVLVAFQQVVKESFALYMEIVEVLTVLLDRFAEMEYAHTVKAFDVYVSAGKMIDELIGFYGWCKDVGVARSSEYPDVQRITDNLLGTLEGFLKKAPPSTKEVVAPVEEEEVLDMNTIKALPAPESCTSTPPPTPEPKQQQQPVAQQVVAVVATEDLVNLRDDGVTTEGEGNKFALALWEEFPSTNGEAAETVTSGWQNPAAERGRADWELALVESTSNLNKQKATMAGGLDALTLNGMYDQGAVKQHVASTNAASAGSASSVVLPGGMMQAAPMLALPAPDGTMQVVAGQDPFAASLAVPPPSYVQMAEMQAKQQMFVHEQQAWQQYGGVHGGQVAMANGNGAGFYNPSQQAMVMMPYGMPQPGGFYNYSHPY